MERLNADLLLSPVVNSDEFKTFQEIKKEVSQRVEELRKRYDDDDIVVRVYSPLFLDLEPVSLTVNGKEVTPEKTGEPFNITYVIETYEGEEYDPETDTNYHRYDRQYVRKERVSYYYPLIKALKRIRRRFP